MYPFLRPLDICVMKPVAPGQPQIGDIIQYGGIEGTPDIVHRVLAVDLPTKTVYVKGDNLPKEYIEHIKISDIKAKVVSTERCGRIKKLSRAYSLFVAFLSKWDLTPHLARKRLFDPIIYKVIKLSGYLRLREKMYESLVFMEKIRHGESYDTYHYGYDHQ